ncbi:GSCFA domain-containing protein [Fibrobacter sp.]|uniref:GSCFA domain-containing protein n=1 Tax=Fibrobacter sp. TaxID=35828 RepID=UPI00386CD4F2
MELSTRVNIPESGFRINYKSRLAFFGSCFADNISTQFASRKFKVLTNPFGTVYNPLSIERMLQNIADGKAFGEQDVFKDERSDGLWHCWDAHSSLSASNREECIDNLNAASAQAREFLQHADIAFITIGSAFVYSLNGNIVANCHRQDPRIFERRLISVEEASQSIQRAAALLRNINRDIHIVFTVSPIRHLGDGAHGNNLSKATVLLAAEKAMQEIASPLARNDVVEYFPSYEIMMDELRDYRFYSDDMIHLSKTAEEYIFERMVETYCDSTTRENMAKVEKFLKMANHRIQDENSTATQELKQKIKTQATELEKIIPGLNLS